MLGELKITTAENEILSDEELINRIKNGEYELFGTIMKNYNQRMYRTAVAFGISDDDAEDMIQQTYIAAFENLNKFQGKAKISTWLIRILINECLMYKRKLKSSNSRNQIARDSFLVTSFAGKHQTPETDYMEKETIDILNSTINQLPEKYRTVYVMREVEEMSIKETAECLGISEMNVKVRLFRSKSLLKDSLKKYNLKEAFPFGNERCNRIVDNVMNHIRNKYSFTKLK